MFKAEPLKKKANYYSIKEATFRLPSDKEDIEAVRREYTNPKTKEEGVAYERAYKALYGVITGVSFNENSLKDGTVLRSINIELGDNEDGVAQIVSIPVDSRYTTDFLKRLPSIDLKREVRLMPYDFEKDGPRQVGVSVYHANIDTGEFTDKIDNNFFTKVEEKDGKKVYTNLHGFPEPTEEDSSDWPFYFKKVSKFLVSYAKAQIIPKFTKPSTISTEQDDFAAFADEERPVKIEPPEIIKHQRNAQEIEEGIDISQQPF